MMRSPDEIKMGLECCGQINGNDCGIKCPYVSQLNCIENKDEDALARILQLEEDKVRSEATITQLSCTIKHLRDEQSRVPRWISVEERLPDVDVDVVLIIPRIEGPCIRVGWLRKTGRWWAAGQGLVPYEVTHWMPLPELPKEVPGENGRL